VPCKRNHESVYSHAVLFVFGIHLRVHYLGKLCGTLPFFPAPFTVAPLLPDSRRSFPRRLKPLLFTCCDRFNVISTGELRNSCIPACRSSRARSFPAASSICPILDLPLLHRLEDSISSHSISGYPHLRGIDPFFWSFFKEFSPHSTQPGLTICRCRQLGTPQGIHS
jgi:hypothetical protein